MYHRVAPDTDMRHSDPALVVQPKRFARQMAALYDAGWTTITARRLAYAMRHGLAVPARSFILSFDDRDQECLPQCLADYIQRFGYVATFYLITSRVQPTNKPWSYTMSQGGRRLMLSSCGASRALQV